MVIGNPPWLMAGYYYLADAIDYLRREFRSAQGKFDVYYLFVEQGCRLTSRDGKFGMIVPNKFFHTKAASVLRSYLSKGQLIAGIVDFGDEQIFPGATNYSCILFLRKTDGPPPSYAKAKAGLAIEEEFDVPWSAFSADTWHFEGQRARSLFSKLEKIGQPLGTLAARFGTGVQSGADRLLVVGATTARAQNLEPAVLRPILRGRDVRRYSVSDAPALLVFPYRIQQEEFQILAEAELQRYKRVYRLLSEHKERLRQRVWFGKGAAELSGRWYGMMYLDSYKSFAAPHLLTPSLSNRSNFALGTGDLFATGTAGVTSFIPKDGIAEHILYILAVLNSRLISFYTTSHSPVFSGGYYKFSSPYLKAIPIRRINFQDSSEKARHDEIVSLVERMLDLNKRVAVAKNPDEKTRLQRQIEATDGEIDRLVYDLYDLTEGEVGIMEGAPIASGTAGWGNSSDESSSALFSRPREVKS